MKNKWKSNLIYKYYPNISLDEYLYKFKKMLYYDRTDVSEGIMLIIQAHQKSMIFVTIGIS